MTDLERRKLRGPVRNMRSEIAEWDRDRQDWLPPFPQTSVTFDERGNAKELEQGVGESVYRTTYTYDATGRLSATQGGTDEKIEYASRYSYDEAGRLTRIVDIDESGAQRTSATYSYTDGRKTEVTFLPEEKPNLAVHHQIEGSETGYSAPGARTVTTSYDDEGRPSEAVFHGAAHTPLREIVLTRDSSGRVIREAAVVPDGADDRLPGSNGSGPDALVRRPREARDAVHRCVRIGDHHVRL
jgi:YD repeat-containing protein